MIVRFFIRYSYTVNFSKVSDFSLLASLSCDKLSEKSIAVWRENDPYSDMEPIMHIKLAR